MVREQGRIQGNIESITQKASEALTDESRPENISDDWMNFFFDKCKLISDDEMQQLWARILTEESNLKHFSKKTIELVATLEKSDAQLFTSICGYIWEIPNFVPLILDSSYEFYRNREANYSNLKHLESLGLISYIQLGYSRGDCPNPLLMSYRGNTLKINFPLDHARRLELGQVLLTQAGIELASICEPKVVDGLPEFIASEYQKLGLSAEWTPSSIA